MEGEDILDTLSIGLVDEDEDVCRVCRVEGDDEQPLIYPCKCSGSVRYVHADCLKNWLAHSQKRYCEICGHPYTFTRVYSDFIPSAIPVVVYVRQAILYAGRAAVHVFRVHLAVTAWLILLPAINMLSLQSLIWLADSLALRSGMAIMVPGTNTTTDINGQTAGIVANLNVSASANVTVLDLISDPWSSIAVLIRVYEKHFVGFLIRGQVLSILLAAALIGFVLLREWINQHNWAEHLNQEPKKEGEIVPDEWVIRDGVARLTMDIKQASERLAKWGKRRKHSGRRRSDGDLDLESKTGEAEAAFGGVRSSLEDLVEADFLASKTAEPAAAAAFGAARQAMEIRREARLRWLEAERRIAALGIRQEASPLAPSDHGAVIELDPAQSSESETTASRASLAPQSGSIATKLSLDGSMYARRSSNLPSWERSMSAPPFADTLLDRRSERTEATLAETLSSGNTPPYSPDSGPSQPKAVQGFGMGVEYTAPELLSENSKGKRKEVDIAPKGQAGSASSGGPYSVDDAKKEPPCPDSSSGAIPQEREAFVEESSQPGTPTQTEGPSNWIEFPNDLERSQKEREEGARSDSEATGVLDDDNSPPGSPREDTPLVLPEAGEQHIHQERRLHHRHRHRDGPNERPARMDAIDQDAQIGEDDWEDGPWEREDWDGILEVAGLIGPIHGLVQNVLFAIIVMGAALMLLVGLPIIIGKAFLTANMIILLDALVEVIQMFVRSLRNYNDPVIDITFDITRDVILYPLSSSFWALERIISSKLGVSATYTPTIAHQTWLRQLSGILQSSSVNLFAYLGHHSRLLYAAYRSFCVRMALSTHMADRIYCVLLGYFVTISAIGVIALAGEANLGRISRTVAIHVKQHTMFLKLALIMSLELAVFPLGVGMIIDMVSIPLFPGASMASRLRYFEMKPAGKVFVSWLMGTLFMYGFANLLSYIRTSCRPGALFFIRDPADPTYSPVKDIVQRPAVSQLRKLVVSALMYSVVVFTLFGAVPWAAARQPWVKILPLNLPDRPISSVPFDLLFLHLVIPPSLNALHLKLRIKRIWTRSWSIMTVAFRLSTIMQYGFLRHNEPGFAPLEYVWPVVDPFLQLAFGPYDKAETKARVPAADQVILLSPAVRKSSGGVFIPLDERGNTKNENDKLRLLMQDRAAREAGRDPRLDYMVVWLPKYWRTRVHVFILAILATSGLAIASVLFVPLIIGRTALGFVDDLHDSYAYLAGAYILWFLNQVGRVVKKHVSQYDRPSRLRRSTASTRFRRIILTFMVNLYAVIMLYLVLPVAVGANFELYVGLPLRYGLSPDAKPVMHFWDIWAIGTIIASLWAGMMGILIRRRGHRRLRRHDPTRSHLEQLREHIRRPLGSNFHTLTRSLFPVLGYLLGASLVPLVLVITVILLLRRFKRYDPSDDAVAYQVRFVFPVALATLLIVASRRYVAKRLLSLRQEMIDAEYVVAERVENYDPDTAQPTESEETVRPEPDVPQDVGEDERAGMQFAIDTDDTPIIEGEEEDDDEAWEDEETGEESGGEDDEKEVLVYD